MVIIFENSNAADEFQRHDAAGSAAMVKEIAKFLRVEFPAQQSFHYDRIEKRHSEASSA